MQIRNVPPRLLYTIVCIDIQCNIHTVIGLGFKVYQILIVFVVIPAPSIFSPENIYVKLFKIEAPYVKSIGYPYRYLTIR